MTDATVPEIPPAGVLRNPTRNPAPTACQLPDPPDWFNPPEERSWRTRLGLHGTARFLRGRVLIGLCATVAVTVALTAFTMWLKPELTGEPTAWLFITLWGGVAMVTVCLAARQAPPGLFALTMLAQAALVVAQSSCQALVPGIFAMSTILIAALLATPVAVLLAACVIVASILVQPAGGSALTDMLSPMWMPQPALLGFAVGWALRHVALSHRRVENLAQRMCSLNELLHKHLQSADELAAARERTRIAQELHDRVGHGLTTTHLYLEVARRRASAESDDVAQALERATESNRDALRELRSCVTLLREPDSDRSLSEAMRDLIGHFPEGVLATELLVAGSERRLEPMREFALFRTLQEAMTNVARHARASRVEVELTYSESAVELVVSDDGVGSDRGGNAGFGLVGIRERLEAVGGQLTIDSAVGAGFRLRAVVA